MVSGVKHLAVCVLVGIFAVTVQAEPPLHSSPSSLDVSVSFWNWLESVVDPGLETCHRDFHNFMSDPNTGAQLKGGRQYLSTAFMMLCNTTDDARRLESLPQFINDQKTKFNSTVDLLFGQAKGNTNSAGLGLWVNAALSLVKTLPSTAELPVLRFDIEYDAKSSDLERVLKQAAWVRKAVNKAFPSPSRRPLVAWALDFASMLPLQASYAPCPAKGQNNKVMLGGKCFLHIVDHVDLMDFRSYAIQAPQNGPCDGAVRFAVPFFETAAELGKTVSVGFETNCGLGEYTYKISFCGPVQEQKYGTADPLDFMYASMADTVQFLRNTSAGLEAFPCAAEPITGLGALSPNKNYWDAAAAPQPLVIEDTFGWNYLAYNGTSYAPLSCPPPAAASWQVCITPEMEAASPTTGLW